ncbi:MAG: hypothetical protein GY835_02845, partial [bacterium]|nr:hypothetical protein [bacterium]
MINNLLRLHEVNNGDAEMLDDAVATIRALSAAVGQRPTAALDTLRGVHVMIREHPGRLDDHEVSPIRSPMDPKAVTISIDQELIQLADGARATFNIVITLAEGMHINAHEPGDEHLKPLVVNIVAGGGLTFQVKYPDGDAFDGPEGKMFVHHGGITLPVTVMRTGAI